MSKSAGIENKKYFSFIVKVDYYTECFYYFCAYKQATFAGITCTNENNYKQKRSVEAFGGWNSRTRCLYKARASLAQNQ